MRFETNKLLTAMQVARPFLQGNQAASSWLLRLATALTIGAAAAVLRVWQARESLWLDELHTAWACGGSLAEVASRAAIGNQSPLFFWLEWAVVQCLGQSELSLRLPSIVAGSLLPVAVFLLADRWMQRGASLCAAALAAVGPNMIYVATEARPYALVQLLAVIHIYLTAALIESPRPRLRLAWVVLAAGLFYLHYTTALFLVAETVFLVVMGWLYPAQVTYRWRSLLVDLLFLGLLGLPAVGHLSFIFQHRGNWEKFIQPLPPWAVFAWWPLSVGSFYLLAAAASERFRSRPSRRDLLALDRGKVLLILTLCWLFIPALIAWMLTATNVARLFFPRYLAPSAPAAMLLGAMAIELAPWAFSKRLLRGLVLAVSSIFILAHFCHDGRLIGDRQDDWRSAVAWLNENRNDHDSPVLLMSGLIEADGLKTPHQAMLDDYCLLPLTAIYPVAANRSDLIPLPFHNPGQLDGALRSHVEQRRSAWLVARIDRTNAQRIAKQLLFDLNRDAPQRHWQARVSRSFGDVQVVEIVSSSTHRQLVSD